MKYSVVGVVIWACAGIYWFFQLISKVVPRDYKSSDTNTLDIFTIEGIFGLDWIDSIPWPQLHPAAEFIATLNPKPGLLSACFSKPDSG